MLAVCEDLTLVEMLQNITCNNVFLDLAANACKGDWPVVAGFVCFSLLEDRSNAGSLPVFWDSSGIQAFLVDDDQER